eukprot:201855_1
MKDVCDDDGRDFVYQSDFDTNGICYALCTNFGTKQWQNPMELGLITVDALHGWELGKAEQVVAREVNDGNYTKGKKNDYISICFKNCTIQPTHYTWRQDTYNGDYPRNW